MSDPLRVGLIGFGNIGAGVVRALQSNGRLIERRMGRRLELVRVADLDTTTDRGVTLEPGVLIDDAEALLADPDIDVVVELIGGVEPARTFVDQALSAGKHVVTANKALLAEHLAALAETAKRHNVRLLYEASVGGGIPCVRALRRGLSGNRFQRVAGIINGTCNYILTQMIGAGRSFEDALADAQRLGFAEPDPAFDVEGRDTAHKIAILASLAFGHNVQVNDVYTEGITAVRSIDVAFAAAQDYAVKMLGLAVWHNARQAVEVRAHPTLIPANSILAGVKDVFNAVLIEGDLVGSSLLYGRGAGPEPTAGAILSDLMAISDEDADTPSARDSALAINPAKKNILPIDDIECAYYVRLTPRDAIAAGSAIATAMAARAIHIRTFSQAARDEDGLHDALVVTERTTEGRLRAALAELRDKLECARSAAFIRIEEDLTGLR